MFSVGQIVHYVFQNILFVGKIVQAYSISLDDEPHIYNVQFDSTHYPTAKQNDVRVCDSRLWISKDDLLLPEQDEQHVKDAITNAVFDALEELGLNSKDVDAFNNAISDRHYLNAVQAGFKNYVKKLTFIGKPKERVV